MTGFEKMVTEMANIATMGFGINSKGLDKNSDEYIDYFG